MPGQIFFNCTWTSGRSGPSPSEKLRSATKRDTRRTATKRKLRRVPHPALMTNTGLLPSLDPPRIERIANAAIMLHSERKPRVRGHARKQSFRYASIAPGKGNSQLQACAAFLAAAES